MDDHKPERPLLLLPGFAVGPYSMHIWKYKLSKTYYSNKGYLRAYKPLNSVEKGSWPRNSVVTVAYYGLNTFSTTKQYAKRLSRSINYVLARTGAEKVDIIGHSMGGLIPRICINDHNCADKIEHLIMFATPNNGTTCAKLRDFLRPIHKLKKKGSLVYASAVALKRLAVLTFSILPEGRELYRNSALIERLSEYNTSQDLVDYTTIAGTRFGGTDGILEASSVALDRAKNIKVCEDHASMLWPSGAIWETTIDALLKNHKQSK